MNLKKLIASLTAAALTCCMAGAFTGAQAEETEKLRIMPLGDSITDGFNITGGYRNMFWKMLNENGYADGIEVVGPNWGGDTRHAGYSGYAIADIPGQRSGIYNFIDWLMTDYPADVVMLQIGTNDILSSCNDGMADRLELLVDSILGYIPEGGLLYVATIPYMDADVTNYTDAYTVEEMDEAVDVYNADVKALVTKKQAEGAQIALSDINGLLTKADLADGVHPNQGGYDKMGVYWYGKIVEYMSGSLPPQPTDPEPEPTTEDICYEPAGVLSVTSKPQKTEYQAGEALDLTGLTVSLDYYYGKDSHDVIYDAVNPLDYPDVFIVDTSEFNSDEPGTYIIRISCTEEAAGQYWTYAYGNETTFEVTVTDLIYEAEGELILNSTPDKTNYPIGFTPEDLDLTGLTVSLRFWDTQNQLHLIYDQVNPLDHPEAFIVDTSAVSSEPGTYTVTVKLTPEVRSRYMAYFDTVEFEITVSGGGGLFIPVGDINSDGSVTVLDVVLLQKYLLGTGEAPTLHIADLNSDGKVNVFDLVLLRRAVLNK